jgi:enoyl-[acyl-carrier protein] reductase II
MEDGAFHLGAAEDAPGIDPERECYPTGQGVGAIQTLIPAASLVTQIVDQAEQVLAGIGKLAGR